MVNALFSSQSGETKDFQNTIGEEKFGWKAIADLYARECQDGRTEKQGWFQSFVRPTSFGTRGQS